MRIIIANENIARVANALERDLAVSVNLFKSRVTRHPTDLTGIRKEPIAGENFKRQERKKL